MAIDGLNRQYLEYSGEPKTMRNVLVYAAWVSIRSSGIVAMRLPEPSTEAQRYYPN